MSKVTTFLVVVIVTLVILGGPSLTNGKNRSFTIDYAKNEFLKDGVPFRYISGSMHYFKIPPELWRDRLRKAKFGGLNAIQTYIQWNTIERVPGLFDFSGPNNFTHFINLAQEEGLLVILRPGPFIDAEVDMGGLPPWLLKDHPNPSLRSMDPHWISALDRYMSNILPKVKPLLYSNGGPVISIQVENEYGSYGPECKDPKYKIHLRDTLRKFLGGNDSVVLFTTDGNGANFLDCGPIPEVLITTDYGDGANVTAAISTLRKYQPKGPVVNSEYYTGWLDHWEENHSKRNAKSVAKTLDEMLSANMSVNMYMIHGGTHFGFIAGANQGSVFQPVPTSYDYDAPITEAGDLTKKFFLIKEVIKKHFHLEPEKHTFPNVSEKMKLPAIKMQKKVPLWDILPKEEFISTNPMSFEQLDHSEGFMLYSARLRNLKKSPNSASSHHLVIEHGQLHDRAQVFVDRVYVGTLSSGLNKYDLNFTLPANLTSIPILEILVENQGHICYGHDINKRKGILSRILVDGTPPLGWAHFRLFDDWDSVVKNVSSTPSKIQNNSDPKTPAFYEGKFVLPSDKKNLPLDSFLKVGPNFKKGFAFLNGHNLGRYWPEAGPQITLYSPSLYFRPAPATNVLLFLEVDGVSSVDGHLEVSFTDHHVLDGPIHKV